MQAYQGSICSHNQNFGVGKMKSIISDDLTGDKLNWLIDSVDEVFADQDENEYEN